MEVLGLSLNSCLLAAVEMSLDSELLCCSFCRRLVMCSGEGSLDTVTTFCCEPGVEGEPTLFTLVGVRGVEERGSAVLVEDLTRGDMGTCCVVEEGQ